MNSTFCRRDRGCALGKVRRFKILRFERVLRFIGSGQLPFYGVTTRSAEAAARRQARPWPEHSHTRAAAAARCGWMTGARRSRRFKMGGEGANAQNPKALVFNYHNRRSGFRGLDSKGVWPVTKSVSSTQPGVAVTDDDSAGWACGWWPRPRLCCRRYTCSFAARAWISNLQV